MNKEQTKVAIEIMQAWVDGKVVEFRFSEDDKWLEAHPKTLTMSWNWEKFSYRLKTTPREFHLQELKLGVLQPPIKVIEVPQS